MLWIVYSLQNLDQGRYPTVHPVLSIPGRGQPTVARAGGVSVLLICSGTFPTWSMIQIPTAYCICRSLHWVSRAEQYNIVHPWPQGYLPVTGVGLQGNHWDDPLHAQISLNPLGTSTRNFRLWRNNPCGVRLPCRTPGACKFSPE